MYITYVIIDGGLDTELKRTVLQSTMHNCLARRQTKIKIVASVASQSVSGLDRVLRVCDDPDVSPTSAVGIFKGYIRSKLSI